MISTFWVKGGGEGYCAAHKRTTYLLRMLLQAPINCAAVPSQETFAFGTFLNARFMSRCENSRGLENAKLLDDES